MAETLSNGTVVNFDGLAPDYIAQRQRHASDLALSLVRVVLMRNDLTADDRASLEGAVDNMLIVKAAREAR